MRKCTLRPAKTQISLPYIISVVVIGRNHYENLPIQIYRKKLTPKIEKFLIKNANTDFFLFQLKT